MYKIVPDGTLNAQWHSYRQPSSHNRLWLSVPAVVMSCCFDFDHNAKITSRVSLELTAAAGLLCIHRANQTFKCWKQNGPLSVLCLILCICPVEDEELGPPPTVDEAADALMTRLGFLLGDKMVSGEPGSPYHGQDDGQVKIWHWSTLSHNATMTIPQPTIKQAHCILMHILSKHS